MNQSDLIFYVPPLMFTIVSLAFLLLWRMQIVPGWQWGAGFAQTAAGFVLSTFLAEPFLAAFASGLIFIGAAYCYGSGLLTHFNAARYRKTRLSFAAVYSAILTYVVYIRQSLVEQLFLTDFGFALLTGFVVWIVARKAQRTIDKALIVSSTIVVFDSLTRTVFFTFFTTSSDDLSDFATSLYNVEVSITTITVCMFFPFIALGASASAAIERHRAVSETDELTGLLNRRGFRQALATDASGNGTPTAGAVIMCDIDHFKRINDTYGHAIGDRVIAGLAEEIKRLVGGRGLASRHGGEEFLAFIPQASLNEAAGLANLLRVAFSNRAWGSLGIDHPVTVSCGVAVAGGVIGLEAAIDRADCALYSAKSGGRDRVVTEGESPLTHVQCIIGASLTAIA